MPLTTLKQLLIDQLNGLYAAEMHSAEVLPLLARAATNERLAQMLRGHAEETTEHLGRLEAVFDMLGVSPGSPDGPEGLGIRGLCADCLKLASMDEAEPRVRDAALIAAAQHVEHVEIAGYGCARTWAALLGHEDAASLLQQTLTEEREADADLTRLSQNLNREAVAAA
ncbi:MAG: ferritin-like domain-containing protein [Phycisphaerales bacterium]